MPCSIFMACHLKSRQEDKKTLERLNESRAQQNYINFDHEEKPEFKVTRTKGSESQRMVQRK